MSSLTSQSLATPRLARFSAVAVTLTGLATGAYLAKFIDVARRPPTGAEIGFMVAVAALLVTFGILASRGRPALLLTGAILATLWAAVVTAGFFSQSQMDASELARLAPLRPFQWSMLLFGWAGAVSGYWSFPAARRARRAARAARGTTSAAGAVGAAVA